MGNAGVCPKCGSDNVQAVSEGGESYSAGCGLLGCLLMGPLGLLFGLLGATPDSLKIVCLSCGHKYLPPGARKHSLLVTAATLLIFVVGLVIVLAIASGDGQPRERAAPRPPRELQPAQQPAEELAPAEPPAELEEAPQAPEMPQQAPAAAARPVAKAPELMKGMTTEGVRGLLGDPVRSTSGGSGDTETDWWWYADGLKLEFLGGKLHRWEETAK